MQILQMAPTFAKYDAVGNDMELIHIALSQHYDCKIYAENISNFEIDTIDINEVLEIIKSRENIVIYHHSIEWKLIESILRDSQAKMLFRYHNVTPPGFYKNYGREIYKRCLAGEAQTKKLSEEYPQHLWLCDSYFNASTVPAVAHTEILPPFNMLDRWGSATPDASISAQLRDNGKFNLLFVGRVVPNKGHKLLLEAVQCYRDTFGKNIHLWIVGTQEPEMRIYNNELNTYIKKYNLEQHVTFIGQVNDSILAAFYRGCDMFVCASQHEGFCVPVVEAQYFGLPVIALDSTAVGETLGPGQVLLKGGPTRFAAAIHVLAGNKEYRAFLSEKGRQNYNSRFKAAVLEKQLLNFIGNI